MNVTSCNLWYVMIMQVIEQWVKVRINNLKPVHVYVTYVQCTTRTPWPSG